ncbi:hypothetical protein VB620_05690 [Nodularia harveyana UHCC-0300]|uniref:Uncharacterized protein n=1 Tax=Nodularia harveyana UHCC-0300 TaxID=2974287 RepID=A0ABU5UBC5_9CYAN|nr:hypothetical protein [Nodularia harveyana]MEA5580832.1 hypothetical protein [Nodularia harveyana UHCC-0300]
MEQNQDQDRQAADQKFQESLEQLEYILQKNSEEDSTPPKSADSSQDVSTNIDLSEWEDAVADIEEYLERKRKK